IYAPCALGATLNGQTIPELKYKIVAGGANNQLDDEVRDGQRLIEQGIAYAPDFLINSGGITNVYYEQQGNYNRDRVYAQTERIYEVCQEVLAHAEANSITSQEAAMNLAKKRIEEIGKVKLTF
ncbi:MAG: leucine dehydrogenase, partial [Bacteroidota bacterium]